MKKIISAAIFTSCMIVIGACVGQNNAAPYLIPDYDYEINPVKSLMINDIIETMDGYGAARLPNWFAAFINGGIEEVERMDAYRNKYIFIGENRNANFGALSKWADNYSPAQDFPRLAAARIEKKLISSASLYPDDEYGRFFETLVKKAYKAEYPGAIKEETYWIKTIIEREINEDEFDETGVFLEVYDFFVFISIDKMMMQTIIRNMMTEVFFAVTPSRAQSAAINRLQQTFFEGF